MLKSFSMFFECSGIKLKTIKSSTRILQNVWKREYFLISCGSKEELDKQNILKAANKNMAKSLRYQTKTQYLEERNI